LNAFALPNRRGRGLTEVRLRMPIQSHWGLRCARRGPLYADAFMIAFATRGNGTIRIEALKLPADRFRRIPALGELSLA
jgi:hypothetical protein